jgi:hypothetical protein
MNLSMMKTTDYLFGDTTSGSFGTASRSFTTFAIQLAGTAFAVPVGNAACAANIASTTAR